MDKINASTITTSTATNTTPSSFNNNHHHHTSHDNDDSHHHHHHNTMPLSQKHNGFMVDTKRDHNDEALYPEMNGSSGHPESVVDDSEGTTPLTFTMYPN